MGMRVFALLFLPVLGSFPSLVWAEAQNKQSSPGDPSASSGKQAIERGLKYLREKQNEKGHWVFEREVPNKDQPQSPKFQPDPTFNLGLTALVALAMVENGVAPSDPTIQKAYSYVKEQAPSDKRTYNLSLTILLLTRLGSREDRPLVQRLARRLMLGQLDSGGWSYECPIDKDREASRTGLQGHSRKPGMGDNSNTQFAVMGLWASSRAGVQVDESLQLVAKRFRESQAPTGGWDYQSTGKGDSNAITCAGVYTLTVSAALASRKAATAGSASATDEASTGKSSRRTSASDTAAATNQTGKEALAQDPVFQKGLSRVEQFAAGIGPGVSPYFLWSVERLGVTLQLPQFGQVDWYTKGEKALLESQDKDGSWHLAWKGIPDTAFSLLFLRKAHLGRDISYALTGDAAKPFVLIGNEKQQAFAKLPEAVAAAADGDVIEIHGRGPFDLAGISCAGKSLTLRSAAGFEPTLVHKLGLLQDPAKETSLRCVLGVTSARLNLEGLRIQMDPPERERAPTAWTAISLDGAELRAVNCNLTQSNNASVTAIELRGGAKLQLRNCMIVGFSTAVDAVVSADQQITLENCLVYSRIGIQAQSPDRQQAAGLQVHLADNTFHVGEVISLGKMFGPAEFTAESNIFHTSAFSTQLRPAAGQTSRKWDGRHNAYDLMRWLSAGGQPLREVRDLKTWREFWQTKEEDSFKGSVPFAVKHELGPFRHNTNPNDWRIVADRNWREQARDAQPGCDVYLIGAGQPYLQFKESVAYDAWQSDAALAEVPAEPESE